MALICDRCGKGAKRGNLVSHSNVKTKRTFRPNLHRFWVEVAGHRGKGKFCTKCLRIVKKSQSTASSSPIV
ncbi:MAG: 50S ribosomal protein L28 [Candidatus Blackburnbacteria bacterium RIFCSPHIGHO2_02_FULL_39_13]|uniref:Large ribosomal subunit protein bL28 n=1 Tax=Candidatus Blackburnbacteria bacterium RIFCSPLOWO2_01_FULL_40_20 TaxID=1797519 RepID=A0A1G1VBI7_9BACT|nr:MAG: 50S ribosomal protein L28 [Candidatus Blackburnbacteria bacterium RIFCSPHIGHO2_01_FULL_40_17]OGY08948.1 MAG: 50S ribosomal protein L28 [Candidatus Blackburnbacteria bacterium RIFCSPHIGHO2_02_FULL_39_13]OGY12706.1 MAG: 50S ribosomal protein L28 [Candidatus Blackburnbacteria bacterium RIFCSPLOWO2_01_FULL_40_20]OGY15186.1 MAG: 50S ribosomal protein L28 [Candidatus Blackburnbacteria bacterium RIFCSPLOWO2_02_FULL_40_10]HBL52357.1 50S ribosomal protein L28 [Candidatus Blackburnbacteria bacter